MGDVRVESTCSTSLDSHLAISAVRDRLFRCRWERCTPVDCPPAGSRRQSSLPSEVRVSTADGSRIYVCDKEERYPQLVDELKGRSKPLSTSSLLSAPVVSSFTTYTLPSTSLAVLALTPPPPLLSCPLPPTAADLPRHIHNPPPQRPRRLPPFRPNNLLRRSRPNSRLRRRIRTLHQIRRHRSWSDVRESTGERGFR